MKKETYLKPEVEALLLQYESPLAQLPGSTAKSVGFWNDDDPSEDPADEGIETF